MCNKIAAVLSTYNGEKFIYEQLNSIINQTYKVDKIYVFDDKSMDFTIQIVRDILVKSDVEYEIVVNDNNKGWKRNFFDALNYAKEEYIFLADQDDVWHETKVEEMMQAILDNPEINLLSSNYEFLFLEGATTEKIAEEKRLIKDGKLMKIEQKPKNFYVRQPGCSYLVRKKFFDEYSCLWNDEMPHDSFLWKTALFTNSLYSLNKPLFKWRRHPSNTTKRAMITIDERVKEVKSNYEYMELAFNLFNNDFASNSLSFCRLRKEMFENKSILKWLYIAFKYRKYYVSNKSCFGDLYLLLGLS